MKKLLTLILVVAALNTYAQTYTPWGTGRTTGHIADLAIYNPSDQPMSAFIPADGNINNISINDQPIFQANERRGNMYFIPGTNKHQSYVATEAAPPAGVSSGTISIPPGDTLHIPIQGYCADIHSPPVPNGMNMPPISSWIGGNGDIPPPASGIPSGFSPSRNPEAMPYVAANVPNQLPGKPLTTSLDKNPGAPEYLFHAINEITSTYDSLFAVGSISTPFSGNEQKERESIIQQTFWIYTSAITGVPYTKDQFHERMVAQYENNTNTEIENAPETVVAKIDEGVDDFWNTFTAVGAEAKVISTNDSFPQKDELEDAFGNADQSGVHPHTESAASEAAKATAAGAVAQGVHVVAGTNDNSTASEETVHTEQNQNPATMADQVKAGATGVEAGDDTENPDQTTAPTSEESKSCQCGNFTAEISFPGIQPGRRPVLVSAASNSAKPTAVEIMATTNDVMRGARLNLKVDKIKLSCTCNGANCPVIPFPDSPFSALGVSAPVTSESNDSNKSDKSDNSVAGTATSTGTEKENSKSPDLYKVVLRNGHSGMRLKDEKHKEQNTDGSAEWEFEKFPQLTGKHTNRVEIEATCATSACKKASCKAIIDISLKIR